MIEYSDQEFEKKLMLLKDTQDAIQSLSTWCLKRHDYYKSIISIWLKASRKVKIEKRLTLFYLANDVIQYSKKKNYKFVDGWATAIQKAIPYVRDDKIQAKISRIIKIWEERGVYDESYLTDLTGLLTTPIQKLKLSDPVQEFQTNALTVKIRSCVKLEQITDLKMKNLREAHLPLTNNEAIQNMLKDRTRSHEFLNELNDGMTKIESYIKCLRRETIDRAQLIDALEVATSYYDEQNGEVKTVSQAYFNYTKRVKLLKTKLESMVGSLPTDSPMPSPDINAPSPSSSSVSIEDIHSQNLSYDSMPNTGKYTIKSLENCNNTTDIYTPATVENNFNNSFVTTESYNTVQELYDPASVSFPAVENQDQQALPSQFPYDAPSPPPDESFVYSEFSNHTNVSYNNEIINLNDKSITYPTDSYEVYVPTPMSSSQQYINPEVSNVVPPIDSTSHLNENIIPVPHMLQTAWDDPIHNNWSNNDTPASPPFHEKISYQNAPIISKTDRRLDLDHCAVVPPKMSRTSHDRDERINPRKMIPVTSDIDHRNLISLTHSPHMNSPVVSSDTDYRAFPGIPMPPSSPVIILGAVHKPQKDNVESVDMDLSDDDEKPKAANHDINTSLVLPPPPPPPPQPISFEFDQQSILDVSNSWENSPQHWHNESSSFHEIRWNGEQQEPWKPSPNHWEQEQSDLSLVHNQPSRQWSQHDPRVQVVQPTPDFRSNWKRENINWPRGPRNFIQNSRSNGRWNQGPRNQPW